MKHAPNRRLSLEFLGEWHAVGEAKNRGNHAQRVASAMAARPPYFDQFIEAMRYLQAFEPDVRPDFAALKQALLRFQSPANAQTYQHLLHQVLLPLSTTFLEHSPFKIANACHSVSHAFRETFRRLPEFGPLFELAITVGNVYYRGENIYQASRDSIGDLIRTGPRDGEDLPVHVWLTLGDMTVLDLTILASLRQQGRDDGGQDGILVWKASDPGDFLFEPLLLDNLFATRVDNITMVYAD